MEAIKIRAGQEVSNTSISLSLCPTKHFLDSMAMTFLIEGFPKISLFPENGPILGFGKVYKVYFYFLLRLTQTITPSFDYSN